MFYHVKELQFNARVSKPDPRFARLLLEQFGGSNDELKAAMIDLELKVLLQAEIAIFRRCNKRAVIIG